VGDPQARRQILVVDDDPDIRDTLQLILSEEGYPVCTATNGNDALHWLRSATPRLILLDLMMPDMDGRQLLRVFEAHPSLAAIPVVVITASTVVATPPGAAGILQKPILLDQLLETVERYP
jgi:CheY-like chemotaxis protein